MKVLFSPIGNTDPMSVLGDEFVSYDGACVHIVRHFQPQVVYLYMSKDILEKDERDNRYEEALHLLDNSIKVVKIKRPELVNVHLFDEFYDDFDAIVNEIIESYGEETTIYCNVSSGTPAMKSTLQILCALSKYNLIPVQVWDPTRGKKKRNLEADVFTAEDFWEINADNSQSEDRTSVSKNESFSFRVQKEMITTLVQSYDYDAAYRIAQEYKYKVSEDIMDLLEFAKERSVFDINKMLTVYSRIDEKLIPYQSSDKIKLFEYALILKNKVERDEIVDFLRGLNPFLYNVLSLQFKKVYGYSIEDHYCGTSGRLLRSRLESDADGLKILSILEKGGRTFRDSYLSEAMLHDILEDDIESVTLFNCINRLDDLRSEERNKASHEMVCIRATDVTADMNRSPNQYLNDIKKILEISGYNVDAHWNSYDQMNQYIIGKLK
ncbi:MAG: hypothetical protein J6P61_02550 [Erysipelotrichaceae bacterium]|nr:hypothetical protein [Erysipelotrichaceae bacterium]